MQNGDYSDRDIIEHFWDKLGQQEYFSSIPLELWKTIGFYDK